MSTRSAEKLQIGAKEHMRLNMQEYEKSSDTDKKSILSHMDLITASCFYYLLQAVS